MYKGFRCIAKWDTDSEKENQQIMKELEDRQSKGQIRQLSDAWGGMSFQSYQMPGRLMRWLSGKHPDIKFGLEWARMDLTEHGEKGYHMGRATWAEKTSDPELAKDLALEVIQEQSDEMYKIKYALSEKVCGSRMAQKNGPDPYLPVTETIWEMLNDMRLDTEYAEYLNRLDDPLSAVRNQWLDAHPEDAGPEIWLMRSKDMVSLSGELDQLIEKMQTQGMDEAQSEDDIPVQEQSL